VERLGGAGSPAETAAAVELVLEGSTFPPPQPRASRRGELPPRHRQDAEEPGPPPPRPARLSGKRGVIEHRYTRWDGSQEPFAPDAEQLLDALAEGLFEHGDLERALQDLVRRGLWGRQGQRMPGLRDLMRQLRERRQERLDRYDLGSVMEDLRRRLDRVLELEWAAVERAEAQPGFASAPRPRGEPWRRSRSLGGAVRKLAEHDFLDPMARPGARSCSTCCAARWPARSPARSPTRSGA
jgi:hypothetical protein